MCMSRPKVPAPTPVIERQPYKTAPSRASLSGDNNESRRRMIAGVATGAMGLLEPASTTKKVRAGGDQQINPVIGGSGPSPAVAPVSSAAPSGPTQGVQTGGGGSRGGLGTTRPSDLYVPSMIRQRPRLA